ncbi:MAG: DUF1538 domain-containing protein [Gammaproteobacteria bacterium]|nr:DUF1538 domain-containing protein [Gammaproteobacteria bacterium]MBU1646941.1 DUF1538 domain-containing protein [Gammaproteobacteria bacterium]MBU1972453.1 DUF1538 domain-containing protein [Gammaproteobacteria bacterium]
MRYGEFLGAVRHKQRLIAYRDVHAADRHAPPRMRLRFIDLHRLLTPYFSVRFFEQLRAVTPLALMLAAFLTLLLRSDVREAESIAIGIVMVMVGLMFFMEGVKHGLMPFSEHIGYALPEKAPTAVVLMVAIILGAMATFAEPAVGALRAAGARVSAAEAPLLYLMLNGRADALVAAVGLGVGLAVAVGMLRYVMGWRLKVLALLTLVPALGLTIFAATDPLLAPLLGLAWDCGAITTGPVTVPLVLSLGIGVAASSGRGDSPLSGFGLVTLASLFPVVSVLLLGIILKGEAAGVTAAAVAAAVVPMVPVSPPPVPQVLDALRAIVPLVLFLWFVQRVGLRQRLRNRDVLAYGIVLAILGMAVFNLGLTTGLVALGDQAGSGIPLAFGGAGVKPLYPYVVGVVLTLGFALLLGYGATVAEPALAAMGATVENLTDGAFRKRLLVRAVAIGVGFGTTIGVARIIFGWPVVWLVLAGYAVAVVLTLLSTEDYVNLAWDSGGVTTGPVTVPLILALGAGLGEATGARDGFGILAMASVGPIISVLGVGLWVRHAARRRKAREQ